MIKYPIYVISKGRWENRLTTDTLDKSGVNYHVIIEPQEHDNYAKFIEKDKILVLPFSNLGCGSIPARNWVWEHAITIGAKKHWILDDNIRHFYAMNHQKRVIFNDKSVFEYCEKFTDKYKNIALSGMNYYKFGVPHNAGMGIRPVIFNTRIYSCILIKNDIPYRWRGRYNEDTDLSLRVLKGGWCTALINAFLCGKQTTMTMKGGNTDELYKNNGRLLMAKSLRDQHPDVVRVVWKWGRWQHLVNYRPFSKNKLLSAQ